jgi:hypothetical protein
LPRECDHGARLGGVHGYGLTADRLLFGVEFADGRRCSTPQPQPQPQPQTVAFPSRFLARCPRCPVGAATPDDVPESMTVLDVGPLLEAVPDVVQLWPWTPAVEPNWEPQVTIPESGWFHIHQDD